MLPCAGPARAPPTGRVVRMAPSTPGWALAQAGARCRGQGVRRRGHPRGVGHAPGRGRGAHTAGELNPPPRRPAPRDGTPMRGKLETSVFRPAKEDSKIPATSAHKGTWNVCTYWLAPRKPVPRMPPTEIVVTAAPHFDPPPAAAAAGRVAGAGADRAPAAGGPRRRRTREELLATSVHTGKFVR